MKIKKKELIILIREGIKQILEAKFVGGMAQESPAERKARMDGRKQAREKLVGKSEEELKTSYIKLEKDAENSYADPIRHALLWGALEQIEILLKNLNQDLPKKPKSIWE